MGSEYYGNGETGKLWFLVSLIQRRSTKTQNGEMNLTQPDTYYTGTRPTTDQTMSILKVETVRIRLSNLSMT